MPKICKRHSIALVPEEVLADLRFRQAGAWSPRALIFAALLWSGSGKATLTQRFAQARKVLAFGAAEDGQSGRSYTGFLKRLGHWSRMLLGRVVAEFRMRSGPRQAKEAQTGGRNEQPVTRNTFKMPDGGDSANSNPRRLARRKPIRRKSG